jgi:vitamin B12 transporter
VLRGAARAAFFAFRFSPWRASISTQFRRCGDALPGRKNAMHPHLKPIAALLPLLFVAPLYAEDESDVIIVTAARQPMRAQETLADVTVINREEIEKSGQDTIVGLLARQPGVQISRNGGPGASTSFYLRGANNEQTKIIVDGIAVNDGKGNSPLRFLPLGNIARIEILRGPASSLYGADAIGGVINIITRQGQPGLRADGFVGYGGHDTQQANAGISGGNEHWRFRVEANHYQTNGFSAMRHARNKDADDDAYRNTGGSAALAFLPAAGHEIGVSYRSNKGVAHYDSGNSPPAGNYDQRNRFETGQWQVYSKNRFLENWESTLRYGETEDHYTDYAWDEWGFYGPPGESISKAKVQNKQASWQNDITLPLGRALVAVEKQKQAIGPRHDSTGADLYVGNPTRLDNTSFLAGWSAHRNQHSWQLNARHDKHSEFGGKTTWGAAYGYQITDALRARASYGASFRAPTIVDLFRPDWGGNPNLKPEEAKNGEVALIWEQGAHLASATHYRNRVKNLIAWVTDYSSSYGGRLENVNKALLEGITLSYAGQFGAWNLRANYDWLNAENQSKNAAGVGYENLGRRARNKASVALTHTWGALESGVEVIGVGRRYNSNYLKTAASKEELGGYALTNLTARYALTKEISLEARVNNLFDKKYETARNYGTDGFNAFVGVRYTPAK